MPQPTLIFMTGPSGAGKSTFAERLAADLRLPLFATDLIKEWLYDKLGPLHEEIHEPLSAACYNVLYRLVEEQLRVGNSLIVESVFWPKLNAEVFGSMLEKYPARVVEAHFTGDPEVLFRRVLARDDSGGRHHGHGRKSEADWADFERQVSDGSYGPLNLSDDTFVVDTTEFSSVDFEAIQRQIAEIISKA